jgi:hypothetical protein
MTTYRDSDLESLIEDLRAINQSSGREKEILKTELSLKISRKELDKLSQLCDSYIYNYERVFYD